MKDARHGKDQPDGKRAAAWARRLSLRGSITI